MFGLGTTEIIVILVIALIIFGPGKLPELGKSLGKSINEFKKATSGVKKEINEAIKDE
jgi:sec-independent protein translocase protein TatA